MQQTPLEIGRVVYSKSGRDAGKYFIIYSVINNDYVEIVDGNYRKIDKPKRKKVKHLTLTNDVFFAIAEKLKNGKKVFDKEIGSALRVYDATKNNI